LTPKSNKKSQGCNS